MRFESVAAHSFGPFFGKTVRFTPGMNVVYGPNESGKSSLHAAVYTALCGVRRAGKGPRKERKAFAEAHRPWSGGSWRVGAVVVLEDGRRVELRHDLHGGVDCRATDSDFGRDVSGEIIHEGSPDGSVWLGLDRRSFLATACVRQADMLSILESPELLQDHLQRAAANASTDATAATAIEALEAFRKENVGLDRANSVKPLARSRRDVRNKEGALENARTRHREFLELCSRAEDAKANESASRVELTLLQAAKARRISEESEAKFEEARELEARHRDAPFVDYDAEDKLAGDVEAALSLWRGRPEPINLEGPDSRELRLRIEALPETPSGDVEPHAAVDAARDAYQDAKRRISLSEENRPPEPSFPETGGLDEETLRDLSRKLETGERGGSRNPRSRGISSLVTGVVVSLAGVLAMAFGFRLFGLPLLILGATMLLWGIYRLGTVRSQPSEERENLRESARERAAAHGVPADPEALRGLADELSAAKGSERDLERWREQNNDLAERREEAGKRLVAALGERGVVENGEEVGNPEILLEKYGEACAKRAEVFRRASEREGLQRWLEDREMRERTKEDHERRRAAAEERMREAAKGCGIENPDPETLARKLKEWQGERPAVLAKRRKDFEEWARLNSLLDGRMLDELEAEASRHREDAARLAEGVDMRGMDAVNLDDVDVCLEHGPRKLEAASGEAARLEGQIEAQSSRLPSVPEAEEELSAAQEEMDRVKRLKATLDRTLQFLRDAEGKVHRDIAPVLAKTVRDRLPEITGGRYVEARVDPERLAVSVRGEDADWRDAARLSHGAREQIYLLLRMSVVEHLTKPGEVCPLILDDVTTQCDGGRTDAILRMLHEESRRRQIVLLSQESAVLEWAKTNLREQRDSIITLDPREIPV